MSNKGAKIQIFFFVMYFLVGINFNLSAFFCVLLPPDTNHTIWDFFEIDTDRIGMVVWRPAGCHYWLRHRQLVFK